MKVMIASQAISTIRTVSSSSRAIVRAWATGAFTVVVSISRECYFAGNSKHWVI